MKNVYWVLAGILVSLLINDFLVETAIYKQSYNDISHVLMFFVIGFYLLCLHLTKRIKGFILFAFPIFLFCLVPSVSTMLDNLFKDTTIIFYIIGCLASIIWSFILLKKTGTVTFNLNANYISILASLALIIIFFIFQSIILHTYKTPLINANNNLREYSQGLMDFNLIINLSSFLIISFLLFLIFPTHLFKKMLQEIVHSNKIKVGFVFLLLIYLFSNLYVIGVEILSGQPISSLIAETGVFNLVGQFVGLLLGVALFEEAMFRLFIPVLLVVLLKNFLKDKQAIFLAMLISSAGFAFVHTITGFGGFANLDYGQAIERLIMLFLSGQIFIYIYIVTRNLWIPIIVHAFNNYSLPFFSFVNFSDNSFENVIWVIVFTSLISIQRWSEHSIINEKVNLFSNKAISK